MQKESSESPDDWFRKDAGASSEPKCEHEFKMKVFYSECKKCGWMISR